MADLLITKSGVRPMALDRLPAGRIKRIAVRDDRIFVAVERGAKWWQFWKRGRCGRFVEWFDATPETANG